MKEGVSRVLMSADGIGGVWTYAIDLSRALGDLGVEVVLAVMGRPLTREQQREALAIPTLTLRERPLKLEWMDDPWADVELSRQWLVELERSEQPDVVHLHGYAYASAPFRAPSVVVAHSCVLSWWQAVKGEDAPPSWDRYRKEVQQGLSCAASLVAPTKAMLSALERAHGEQPRAQVIENGCDLARYAPDLKEPLIFAAGRLWDEAKNLEVLAAVAPTLPWTVYVAGDAQRPAGVQRTVEASHDAVRQLGVLARGDMAKWLGRAAIFAHPARYEPFGLTVLEAAASGCALVLGDIPTLRELWHGAALFVEPSDRRALRDALVHLMEDESLREQLASLAVQRAARFDLGRFGEAYASHYASLHDARHTGTRALLDEPTMRASHTR